MAKWNCAVCRHEQCPLIDAALVVGERTVAVAARFGFSVAAVKRHRARHLPRELVEAGQLAEAGSTLAQLRDIQRRARAYEAAAVADGDRRGALLALRESRATAEL